MRWIVRTVFALIFVVVLAVGALFAIPTEKIASLAVSQFNALTGRDLVISGAVRPSFYPTLGVQTGPISVSNAEWSSAGPMLSAQALSIGLDARALIAGEVKITSLQAIDPKIVLERSTKGQENWVFGAAAAGGSGGTISTQTPGVGSSYSLDQAMISGGEVVFIDHAAGTKVALSKITARASLPSYTGPASFDLTAQMNGQDFSAKGRVDGFQDFLDGKVGGAALDLSAGAAQISFQGRAGWAGPVAEGNLQADLADLRAISALAGLAAPQMPAGLGQRAVQLAGAVTLTQAGSAYLRGGSVVLDGAKLSVDADYTPGARAKISAKVVAGALNLASASGGAGGGAGGGAQAQGWPQDRIDLSALSAMDADISLSAQGLDLGMVKLGAVQAVVRLDNARLVMDVAKAAGYGGTMAGNLVVNGRNGVSVAGDLAFRGMDLQALLRDFGGYERLLGTGDLTLKFLSSGNTVDAIMHKMSGSGALSLTRGQVLGLDIAGMLRRLDTSYVGAGQKTVFDALTGTFTITGGVLRNDDLLLASSDLTARGVGEVDLGARSQSYRIKATALAGADGSGGLTAPLLISGTWASPKFALDLQAIADEKLAEQKAKLQAQLAAKKADLETKARAEVAKKLGVTQAEGESVQDAARRAAEQALKDQAAKALGKLLGGN